MLIGLGLASRAVIGLPVFVRDHAGDALWAAMVYWGFAFLFPKQTIWQIATYAVAFSLCIELSQLSQHPFLQRLRGNRIGALVLGHGFLWLDLVRYIAGVALAMLLDVLLSGVNNKCAD